MIWPFVLMVGGLMALFKFGRTPPRNQQKTDEGPTPLIGTVPESEEASVYSVVLLDRLRRKEPLSEALVLCAIDEAWRLGEWEAAETFAALLPPEPAFETQEETKDDAPVAKSESDVPATPSVESAFSAKSPIDAADDDQWLAFVEAMKSQDAGFDSPTHRGAYHHHKKRLAQLGVTDMSTPQAQHDALAADISDIFRKEVPTIQQYNGEVLQVKGQTVGVTPSGILAVMKSAGPKGAVKWLTDESDRDKYPHTTEAFLRCNGCF